MQRIITYVVLICTLFQANKLSAQQEFQISQYMFNPFSFNPAYAGTKDCIDATIGARLQWLGFQAHRIPNTKFFNIHGAFKNKYKFVKTKHAAGLSIMNDQAGRITNTRMMLAYAYHVPLSYKVNMSMGVYAGAIQYKFAGGDLRYGDITDPAIPGAVVAYLYPDVTAGLRFVTWKKAFYALSASQLVGNRLPEIGNSRLERHFQFMAGKAFENQAYDMEIIPSVLVKFAPFSAPAVDANLLFNFSNAFAVGASYRAFSTFSGIMQVKFMRYFTLGYSYDYSLSKTNLVSINTHEITIGIDVCPEKTGIIIDCPAFN